MLNLHYLNLHDLKQIGRAIDSRSELGRKLDREIELQSEMAAEDRLIDENA